MSLFVEVEEKQKAENKEAVIEIQNIQKTYLLGVEGVPAIRGVSAKIYKGEFVIIYGTSGGGKTSLLNIIGTIDKPTKGYLTICGKSIRSKSSDSLLADIRLKKMGFVFQSFNLLSNLTALENVELPMILKGVLSRGQRRKRAKELLSRVGMGDRLKHKPAMLSGGEQQRVTIARALANRPDILLLDEPTGDLDSKNTENVLSLLYDLNIKEGITMIMVTHDPNLKNGANRIIWMRDGKIAKLEKIALEDRKLFWNGVLKNNPLAESAPIEETEKEEYKNTEIRNPNNYEYLGDIQKQEKVGLDILKLMQPDAFVEKQDIVKSEQSDIIVNVNQ